MSKGKRRPKKSEAGPAPSPHRPSGGSGKAPAPAVPGAGDRPVGQGTGRPGAGRRGTWLQTHGRDLRFLGFFAGLMAVYYGATTAHPVSGPDGFFDWYLELNAEASAGILHAINYADLERKGKSLVSPRGSITVERGCDAVEPSALFVAAVLASPVAWRSKLLAAVAGTALLMVINLVRIISLFLTAVHWRKAFDIMHLDVWQAAFIFFAIVLWALWASWVTKKRPRQANAEA